ncbi:hypothetical protein Trydic_g21208 [Trypoxylus dichotomus]
MLFEILPVIVYQLAGPRLTELPVELIAGILRYLDPESLLNVVKVYKVCKDVTLGDPILRRRLKTLLKEKKKLEIERRINPALGVTVTRKMPVKMFGTNLEKDVVVNPSINQERLEDIETDFFGCRKRKNSDDIALPAIKSEACLLHLANQCGANAMAWSDFAGAGASDLAKMIETWEKDRLQNSDLSPVHYLSDKLDRKAKERKPQNPQSYLKETLYQGDANEKGRIIPGL